MPRPLGRIRIAPRPSEDLLRAPRPGRPAANARARTTAHARTHTREGRGQTSVQAGGAAPAAAGVPLSRRVRAGPAA